MDAILLNELETRARERILGDAVRALDERGDAETSEGEAALLLFLLLRMADTAESTARPPEPPVRIPAHEEFFRTPVPVPPVEIQRALAAELAHGLATLTGVASLDAGHEAHIRARLAAVWGETPPPGPALSPADPAA